MNQNKKSSRKERAKIQRELSLSNENERKNKPLSFLSEVKSYIGILLFSLIMFYCFDIYDRTIIEFFTLLKISVFLTIVILSILKLVFRIDFMFFGEEWSLTLILLCLSCLLSAFLFVIGNNFSLNAKYQKKEIKIIEKGELSVGRRSNKRMVPAICIRYKGEEKWIKVSSDENGLFAKSKYASISLKTGLFGYSIFDEIELINPKASQ